MASQTPTPANTSLVLFPRHPIRRAMQPPPQLVASRSLVQDWVAASTARKPQPLTPKPRTIPGQCSQQWKDFYHRICTATTAHQHSRQTMLAVSIKPTHIHHTQTSTSANAVNSGRVTPQHLWHRTYKDNPPPWRTDCIQNIRAISTTRKAPTHQTMWHTLVQFSTGGQASSQ